MTRRLPADPAPGPLEGYFKEGLEQKGIPYVLSLKPSHAWWHPIDEVGWVEGVAQAAYWNGPDDPGEWTELERRRKGKKGATLDTRLRTSRGRWRSGK